MMVCERRLNRMTYNIDVITRGISEFLARDWASVRASKDAYWSDRIRRLGALEALRIADELRGQARKQHPGWPDPESRREDLTHHVQVTALFHRVRSARGR